MVRSIVGTLVNVGLNKITLDDFNAIIVHKTEIKLGFQYQHMVCIWLKLNTIIYKINGCKTICKLGMKQASPDSNGNPLCFFEKYKDWNR
jgi:hypothetical protein